MPFYLFASMLSQLWIDTFMVLIQAFYIPVEQFYIMAFLIMSSFIGLFTLFDICRARKTTVKYWSKIMNSIHQLINVQLSCYMIYYLDRLPCNTYNIYRVEPTDPFIRWLMISALILENIDIFPRNTMGQNITLKRAISIACHSILVYMCSYYYYKILISFLLVHYACLITKAIFYVLSSHELIGYIYAYQQSFLLIISYLFNVTCRTKLEESFISLYIIVIGISDAVSRIDKL